MAASLCKLLSLLLLPPTHTSTYTLSHAYVHTPPYTHTFTLSHIYMHALTGLRTHLCTRTHTPTYMHPHTRLRTYTHTHTRLLTHPHTRLRTLTHTPTYTDSHTYTQLHAALVGWPGQSQRWVSALARSRRCFSCGPRINALRFIADSLIPFIKSLGWVIPFTPLPVIAHSHAIKICQSALYRSG